MPRDVLIVRGRLGVESENKSVRETAERMRLLHSGSSYSAEERASDHAFANDAGAGREFWLAVGRELRKMRRQERRRGLEN